MSIIYDALKKVEASNSQNLKVPTPKKPKHNFKIYLLYLLVTCGGGIIASIFFGLFTKPSQVVKTSLSTTSVVAENKTTTTESISAETSLKGAEFVSVANQTQRQPLPTFVLNGVFFSQDERYALVNNQIVKEGDVIEGVMVKRIALNEVELESEGSIIKLSTTR